MKKALLIHITLLISVLSFGQSAFDKMLRDMYMFTVPQVKAEQLYSWLEEDVYLLDIRETEEYEVSRIDKARHAGYKNFQIESLNDVPKDTKIVVYCSVGYRSERIGEKLINAGYKEVYNLYGGIFEWVNKGYDVYNDSGKVRQVHAYNKEWGKWVDGKKCQKMYE